MSGFSVDPPHLDGLAHRLVTFADQVIELDTPSLDADLTYLGDPDVAETFDDACGTLHNAIDDMRVTIVNASVLLARGARAYERADETIAREAGY